MKGYRSQGHKLKRLEATDSLFVFCFLFLCCLKIKKVPQLSTKI